MRVLVGVVTYNPDEDRLRQCLESVKGEDTYIFDNTKDNKGIAFALKSIMDYAVNENYDYVLTLDQDSVVKDGLIEKYKENVSPDIGALTCVLEDRNFHEKQETGEVEWCITSGCFMSVEAYRKTSGYDERLFIDMVDMDICYSLREAGYRIVCIPFVGLEHEVGCGRNTFLGIAYNHAAWRDYYIVRNRLIVSQRHGIHHSALRVARDMIIILLFENDKNNKLKACFSGITDYFKNKNDIKRFSNKYRKCK